MSFVSKLLAFLLTDNNYFIQHAKIMTLQADK
ncbi:hypothetical protein VINE108274_03860 [Vibrio neptunius]